MDLSEWLPLLVVGMVVFAVISSSSFMTGEKLTGALFMSLTVVFGMLIMYVTVVDNKWM